MLQEIARADESNWLGFQEAVNKARGIGRGKAELVTHLERLASQRREAMLGIRKALDEEVARIRKAEEEDGAYLALLDQQGDYMRELERANSVRPSSGKDAVLGATDGRNRGVSEPVPSGRMRVGGRGQKPGRREPGCQLFRHP